LEVEKKFAPTEALLCRLKAMPCNRHELLVDVYFDTSASTLMQNDFWLRRRWRISLNSRAGPAASFTTTLQQTGQSLASVGAADDCSNNHTAETANESAIVELKWPAVVATGNATVDTYQEISTKSIETARSVWLPKLLPAAQGELGVLGSIVSCRRSWNIPAPRTLPGFSCKAPQPVCTVVVDEVAFSTANVS
jgi:hypothetical protein